MIITTLDLDKILDARNKAEFAILDTLSDVRMDDVPALTEALKQLDVIKDVMHKIVTN